MNPNFLVAGAAKCGTTSLYYYLIQHPEVSIPKKETFYFIKDFYANPADDPAGRRNPDQLILSKEAYEKLYASSNSKATGEVSTCYLHFPEMAIPEIKAELGDPKIIIIIREPVERAFSGYKHFIRLDRETLALDKALEAEEERKAKRWDFMWEYKGLGYYSKGVDAFQKNFTNVKVILSEDLENNTTETMQDLFRFLEIDDSFVPETGVKYNISDSQKHNFWFRAIVKNEPLKRIVRPVINLFFSESDKSKWVHKLRRKDAKPFVIMDEKIKLQLKKEFRDDILKLQQLINRDLKNWL